MVKIQTLGNQYPRIIVSYIFNTLNVHQSAHIRLIIISYNLTFMVINFPSGQPSLIH